MPQSATGFASAVLPPFYEQVQRELPFVALLASSDCRTVAHGVRFHFRLRHFAEEAQCELPSCFFSQAPIAALCNDLRMHLLPLSFGGSPPMRVATLVSLRLKRLPHSSLSPFAEQVQCELPFVALSRALTAVL